MDMLDMVVDTVLDVDLGEMGIVMLVVDAVEATVVRVHDMQSEDTLEITADEDGILSVTLTTEGQSEVVSHGATIL